MLAPALVDPDNRRAGRLRRRAAPLLDGAARRPRRAISAREKLWVTSRALQPAPRAARARSAPRRGYEPLLATLAARARLRARGDGAATVVTRWPGLARARRVEGSRRDAAARPLERRPHGRRARRRGRQRAVRELLARCPVALLVQGARELPRVGAARARRRRRSCSADERTPMHGGEGGWWESERDAVPGAALRVRARRRRAARRPARARAARRARGAVAGRRPRSSSRVETVAVARRRSCAGAVIYELHVGTFTPEGTLDAAIERLDHLVDARRRHRRGDAARERSPAATAGATTASASTPCTSPTAGPSRFRRFVDACHARGLGVCLDVVYNHLGPSGNYLPRVRPVLHRPLRDAVGRGRQPRRRRQRRGAPLRHRQRR